MDIDAVDKSLAHGGLVLFDEEGRKNRIDYTSSDYENSGYWNWDHELSHYTLDNEYNYVFRGVLGKNSDDLGVTQSIKVGGKIDSRIGIDDYCNLHDFDYLSDIQQLSWLNEKAHEEEEVLNLSSVASSNHEKSGIPAAYALYGGAALGALMTAIYLAKKKAVADEDFHRV